MRKTRKSYKRQIIQQIYTTLLEKVEKLDINDNELISIYIYYDRIYCSRKQLRDVAKGYYDLKFSWTKTTFLSDKRMEALQEVLKRAKEGRYRITRE